MHVEALSSEEALFRLDKTLSTMQVAKRLLSAIPGRRLYLASYRFGQWITSPRTGKDTYSRLRTPCEWPSVCQPCESLLADTERHRPLGIVLRGAVEEFAVLPRILREDLLVRSETGKAWLRETPDREEADHALHHFPLGLSRAGELVNLVEVANTFVFPDYGKKQRLTFDMPVRRAVAGARSIHLLSPVSDANAVPRLKEVVPKETWSKYFGDWRSTDKGKYKEVAHQFGKRPHDLLKMLSEAAGSQWITIVLWIPIDALTAPTEAISEDVERFKGLVLEQAWKKVRPTHNHAMRSAAIVAAMQPSRRAGDKTKRLQPAQSTYVDHVLQHILDVSRGDTLCHAPWNLSDDCGPFADIQKLLSRTTIATKGIWHFPAVLVPSTLGLGPYNIGYFSFAEPALAIPGKVANRMDVMRIIRARISQIADNAPSLTNRVQVTFFQGQQGAPHRRGASGFASFRSRYKVDERIARDFASQFKQAKNLWGVRTYEQMFPGAKEGFMSRFVRFEMSA